MRVDDFTSAVRKDIALHMLYLAGGHDQCAAVIEEKYCVYGMSPQQFREELADIVDRYEEERHG